MKTTFPMILGALALLACAAEPPPILPAEQNHDALTSAQRRHHLEAIRDVAAARGITNALPLAGVASAESLLQQCDEGTFCPGPWSSYCNGAVMAGGSDGACWLREGGIGMFQLDGGDYDATIARDGARVLSLEGNIEAGIDFILNMLRTSPYGPRVASDEAAIAWLEGVTIDGPRWNAWLEMVTKSYNGCESYPAWPCNERYANYDEHSRFIRAEAGTGFWDVDGPPPPPSGSAGWVEPLADFGWQIDFNLANPGLGSRNTCFDQPFNTLTHAGEDWSASAGSTVRSIGAGTVRFVSEGVWYPGSVIVVEHALSAAARDALGVSGNVFSMYGHLTGIAVSEGQRVRAGDALAQVLHQDLRVVGDGANSHLHWEVRTMLHVSAGHRCGTSEQGPGYTQRGTDARDHGYLDPSAALALLASVEGEDRAVCDNDVQPGGTACNPASPETEYVCAAPGTDEPWEARACAPGWRCSGDRCVPPCDNGVPVGATACAGEGQTLEYVCARPEASSSQQWDARDCAPGESCQGASCAPIDASCAGDAQCPAGQTCEDGRCEAPPTCTGSADCATGEACLSGVCRPSQGGCGAWSNVSVCDAHASDCAWYFCSDSCWPRGTSNAVACM